MNFSFDNNLPIYVQLVDELKKYIVSGEIKPGEKLMSVRDLANVANYKRIEYKCSKSCSKLCYYYIFRNVKYVTSWLYGNYLRAQV